MVLCCRVIDVGSEWRTKLNMVLCCRVIDVGSEWRTFSNEKSTKDASRVGAAEVRVSYTYARIAFPPAESRKPVFAKKVAETVINLCSSVSDAFRQQKVSETSKTLSDKPHECEETQRNI